MEIVKVFTRYDILIATIRVPCCKDITVGDYGIGFIELSLVGIEQGLEGVYFAKYREL